MSNSKVSAEHAAKRRKQLIKYVLPSVLSMLSVFLYTIVDGIFVGRGVGQDGLGAVNLAFPFVMIFTAVVMLVSIGGLTITAIRKGRGDYAGMNQSFMHSITAVVIISVIFMLLGTVFVEPMARLMGANETFFDMVCEYIFWYAVFMVPCGLFTGLSGAVRNDDGPVLVSAATIISTALNIVGDWVFVFPLHMGLKGAAIATGLAQSVGLLVVLTHFFRKQGVLRFSKFRVDWSLYRLIFVRGLPECVSQFNPPIVTILVNYVIIRYLNDMAVNTFAVIGYVGAFSVAVFCGVAEGLQPLFGNCYGEKNTDDLIWYRRVGIIISFLGSAVIYVLLLFFGEPIYIVYGVDAETVRYTIECMPKYALGFIVQSFTTIISSYLYSTTRSAQALTINVLRSLIVDTVVILVFPKLLGPEIIWYTFPIYEFIVLVIAVIIMVGADRKGIIQENAE